MLSKLRTRVASDELNLHASDDEYEALVGDTSRVADLQLRQAETTRRLRGYLGAGDLDEVAYTVRHRPAYVVCFPMLFDRLESIYGKHQRRHVDVSRIAELVTNITALPNYRRATNRSAITKSFVALCMRVLGNALVDTLIDVIVERKPRQEFIERLFGGHRLTFDMGTAVARWLRETPYALPLHASYPHQPARLKAHVMLLHSAYRDERIGRYYESISVLAVEAALVYLDDRRFYELAVAFMRPYYCRHTSLKAAYVGVVARRFRHVEILELLLALAPLFLPVYLIVDIIDAMASPGVALSVDERTRIPRLATRIMQLQRAAEARKIDRNVRALNTR